MLVCTKCGAFSNDPSPAFCINDGTPMIDVDPNGKLWDQGTQFIENTEKAARRQSRKLKWRRVIVNATTILVTTMVISVIAVNALIYLKPPPRQDVSNDTSPPSLAVVSQSPASSPLDTPAASPSPSIDVGVPVIGVTATPTPREITTSGSISPETPTPTPTATATPTATPTPMDSPTPRPSRTATPTPTVTQTSPAKSECSEADQNRDIQGLIKRFESGWGRSIQSERAAVIASYAPDSKGAEATLGPISYQTTIVKACASIAITARYTWTVRTRTGVPGAVDTKGKTVTVPKSKRFLCGKLAGMWLCTSPFRAPPARVALRFPGKRHL
jgi:hypothetical protein